MSPLLTDRKQQALQEKLNRAPEPVVYEILGTAQCSECGAEMKQGSLLFQEAENPLCMACAGLGDLEFLAAGDAALTRRAAKYSARTAVVVRFSRARKRYEMQGILVENAALEKAEGECLEDATERAAARHRDAARRCEQDRDLVLKITKKIDALFPSGLSEPVYDLYASRGGGIKAAICSHASGSVALEHDTEEAVSQRYKPGAV